MIEAIPFDLFETAPFLIPNSDFSDNLASELGVEEFEEMLWLAGRHCPQSIQVSRDSKFLGADEISSGDIVRRLSFFLDDGYSIALNFAENLSSKLAKKIYLLGEYFGCVANGSLFLSPPNGATFRPHYDAIDVLAIQLEGSKIWRVGDAPSSLPLNKNTYAVEDCIVDGEDFNLAPRNALYVPRGKIHDVRASEHFSLHLSVGLGFLSHGTVLKKSIDLDIESSIELRRTNTSRFSKPRAHLYPSQDFRHPSFNDYQLRIAEQSLYASALSKQSQISGRLRSLLQSRMIDEDTYFRREYACEITREFLSDGLIGIGFPGLAAGRFSKTNAFLTFPQLTLSILEQIRDCKTSFRATDLSNLFTVEDRLVILRRLVAEGLLQTLE